MVIARGDVFPLLVFGLMIPLHILNILVDLKFVRIRYVVVLKKKERKKKTPLPSPFFLLCVDVHTYVHTYI